MVLVHYASFYCILSPFSLVFFTFSTCPPTIKPPVPHFPSTAQSQILVFLDKLKWEEGSQDIIWVLDCLLGTATLRNQNYCQNMNNIRSTYNRSEWKRNIGWESWERECSGWAITGCKRGWETSPDMLGPRGERVQIGKKEGMSQWRILAPLGSGHWEDRRGSPMWVENIDKEQESPFQRT